MTNSRLQAAGRSTKTRATKATSIPNEPSTLSPAPLAAASSTSPSIPKEPSTLSPAPLAAASSTSPSPGSNRSGRPTARTRSGARECTSTTTPPALAAGPDRPHAVRTGPLRPGDRRGLGGPTPPWPYPFSTTKAPSGRCPADTGCVAGTSYDHWLPLLNLTAGQVGNTGLAGAHFAGKEHELIAKYREHNGKGAWKRAELNLLAGAIAALGRRQVGGRARGRQQRRPLGPEEHVDEGRGTLARRRIVGGCTRRCRGADAPAADTEGGAAGPTRRWRDWRTVELAIRKPLTNGINF